LFYDPLESRLYDYVGGQADLERRLLRAIGDPLARFTEDKLRMMRAVRLSARFEFELEEQTAQAVRQMVGQIGVVSAERIAQELRKIVLHRTRRLAIERADRLGLLGQILPDLVEARGGSSHESSPAGQGPAQAWRQTLDALDALNHPTFELAIAALLDPLPRRWGRAAGGRKAEGVLRRLKLSNAEIDKTRWLLTQVGAIDQLPSGPLWQWKELLGEPWVPELLQLERVQRLARGESLEVVESCEQFLRQTPAEELRPAPLVTGDDLIRLNFKPGKGFKELLRELYRAQLDGRLVRFEQVPELLPQLMGDRPDPPAADSRQLPP
jgi:poly(A) polymerase